MSRTQISAEEEEEKVDEAQHPLEDRPGERPPVPQDRERFVADRPYPDRHHAHRLAPRCTAEQGPVGDVEHTRDQERHREKLPPPAPPAGPSGGR